MGFLLSFFVPALVIGSRLARSARRLSQRAAVAAVCRRLRRGAGHRDGVAPAAISTVGEGIGVFTLGVVLPDPAPADRAGAARHGGDGDSRVRVAVIHPAGKILLVLTTGVFSAMFAITVAHELIHRRQKLDRFLGRRASVHCGLRHFQDRPPAGAPSLRRHAAGLRDRQTGTDDLFLLAAVVRRQLPRSAALRAAARGEIWQVGMDERDRSLVGAHRALAVSRRGVVGMARRAVLRGAERAGDHVSRRHQLPAALRADAAAAPRRTSRADRRIIIRGRRGCSWTT